MTYITKDQPAFKKANLALFSGSFITFMILYSVQTLFPLFSEEFDVTPAASSLSLSVTTGFLAITMLFASLMSDSFGRKRIMSISLTFSALLCILAAFSPNFSTLLAIRVLQGIVLAGFPAIAMTYVSEEFHPKHLGIAMGIYVSGTTVGGLAGRMATGIITSYFSWQTALLAIGAVSLLLSLWFWRSLPAPKNSAPNKKDNSSVRTPLIKSFAHNLRNPRLLCLYGISFLLMGGFVTIYNYLGYRLMAPPYFLSQAVIGSLFIVYLVGTFSSTFMGKMSDSFGKPKTLPLSILLMLSGVLLTLNDSLLLIITGIAVLTFGFFGSHSIASNWVGELASDYRAQAASLYLLAYYLGSSIVGTSGGIVWKHLNWGGIVTMTGLLTTASLVLVTIIVVKTRKKSRLHQENSAGAGR
ncbi:MFS transporter [Evansella clarkii]|uniref:MFS transporter n=1 Tax=Evansella clarkii TaxID=79879 RepID=UPI000998B6A5